MNDRIEVEQVKSPAAIIAGIMFALASVPIVVLILLAWALFYE